MAFDAAFNRLRIAAGLAAQGPRILRDIVASKLRGGDDAAVVLEWLLAVNGTARKSSQPSANVLQVQTPLAQGTVRMFGWELTYFSGKGRRMVVAYQMWMLERLEATVLSSDTAVSEAGGFLFPDPSATPRIRL
mmetsp:Transcript_21546/g.73887  ORF Transcript_21546/g.73887 Transcript_21546/m.73887 type:complete len:134 (-) Transcript_21546:85-486(-)